jgi:hypothetical protein
MIALVLTLSAHVDDGVVQQAHHVAFARGLRSLANIRTSLDRDRRRADEGSRLRLFLTWRRPAR